MGDKAEVKTWRNNAKGTVGIRKFDPITGREHMEPVRGGKVFSCTEEERRYNQEKISDESRDPWFNGTFSAVELVDTADDLDRIIDNPNALTETQITEMFNGNWKTMQAQLNKIDSMPTLKRILAVGDEVGATTKRIDLVKQRIGDLQAPEVEPELAVEPPAPVEPQPEHRDPTDMTPHPSPVFG